MQDRLRFPITSEQCELLVAFEAATSMSALAKALHKDPSVISRGLQSLAETGVLEKVGHKWSLTPLGRQINNWTRTAASVQIKIFEQQSTSRFLSAKLPSLDKNTALIVIGVQNGFDDSSWGARNNFHAEQHIELLLQSWRKQSRSIYHIQHLSKEPSSPLRPGTLGADFKPFAKPRPGETILQKSTNSAFAGTQLENILREKTHDSLVVAGFSTNHCIDATVRAAGDLGFSVFVVSDACVSFDRISIHGERIKADETHKVVMANLNQEFATVVDAQILLDLAST